jgi:hypothetical protein
MFQSRTAKLHMSQTARLICVPNRCPPQAAPQERRRGQHCRARPRPLCLRRPDHRPDPEPDAARDAEQRGRVPDAGDPGGGVRSDRRDGEELREGQDGRQEPGLVSEVTGDGLGP